MRNWILCLCIICLAASSYGALAVDVISVRFSEKRLPGQSYPWHEVSITLRAVRTGVHDLTLQFWERFRGDFKEAGMGGTTTRFQTFHGKVKISAIDHSAIVRFYIPPDVVRVRRLSQSPETYHLTVASNFGPEPYEPQHSNARTSDKPVLTPTSDALSLLPHYQTPFYSISDTFRDMPAYDIPQ